MLKVIMKFVEQKNIQLIIWKKSQIKKLLKIAQKAGLN